MKPLRRLVAVTVALLVIGCQTTRAPDEAVGFEVGQVYELVRPLAMTRSGERFVLVPGQARKGFEDEQYISAGTRLRVVAIRRDNTLTYGRDVWPEGMILSGPEKGRRVSLGHPDLMRHLKRVDWQRPDQSRGDR